MAHVEPMRVLYAPDFDLSTLFCKIIKIFLQLADPAVDFVKTVLDHRRLAAVRHVWQPKNIIKHRRRPRVRV
jgi:hypothetical protein